jgi:hypothetical protein
MKIRGRRGNTIIEAAIFIPILLTLLVATEELGKMVYTYYNLRNALYAAARYVGTQQAVNFCDAGDPNIVAAQNMGATGTTDASALPLIQDFTPDMIQITAESYSPPGQFGTAVACPCQNYGDGNAVCYGPDLISVTIPAGYKFTPNIPFAPIITISLVPQALIPYGGT